VYKDHKGRKVSQVQPDQQVFQDPLVYKDHKGHRVYWAQLDQAEILDPQVCRAHRVFKAQLEKPVHKVYLDQLAYKVRKEIKVHKV
jgi:hypothetical protein